MVRITALLSSTQAPDPRRGRFRETRTFYFAPGTAVGDPLQPSATRGRVARMAKTSGNSGWSLASATFALFFSCIAVAGEQAHSYVPPNGAVPDGETAVAIAEAILIPIYGRDQILSERPFRAILKNEIWAVEGSLPRGFLLGGVAVVEPVPKARG